MDLKCMICVEEYLALPDDSEAKLSGEAWLKVRDADTLAPSWQTYVAGPGQVVVACVTLPVCLRHITVKKQSPEQIASRSGLALPGQGFN